MSDVMAGRIEVAAQAEMPMLPLAVRDLRLAYGLDGVSLDLRGGGCTMVMGANGAGKSLLLRALHGLVRPVSGFVSWGGSEPEAVRHRQAMVFQTPVLLRRTVAQNLDFVCKDKSLRDELLSHVGLAQKAGQPARMLSGGEAQRLALARALAMRPEVLLLDEPTASLDPASTQAIEDIVQSAIQRGVKVIFVSHDLGQARRMGHEVIFLSKGRVAEHSDIKQFLDAPQSRAAQDYLAGRLHV